MVAGDYWTPGRCQRNPSAVFIGFAGREGGAVAVFRRAQGARFWIYGERV